MLKMQEKISKTVLVRIATLSTLVALEVIFLIFFMESSGDFSQQGITFYELLRASGGVEFLLAYHTQKIVLITLLSAPIPVLIILFKERSGLAFIEASKKNSTKLSAITLNIVAYIIVLYLSVSVQNPTELIGNPFGARSILYSLLPLFWLLYIYSAVNLIIAVNLIFSEILKNKFLFISLFLATATTIDNPIFLNGILDFWSEILLKPTLILASFFSKFLGLTIEIFPPSLSGIPIFGTSKFQVEILPGCSGYEGMTLIMILLAFYCYLQRGQLYLSRAILIIPIAAILMFFLNSIRLAILILIGDAYSPELALNGFHLVGGWLDLLISMIFSLLALNKVSFFLKNVAQTEKTIKPEGLYYLYPLFLLITTSLFTKIFVPDFNWLYPIPVSISAITIFLIWDKLQIPLRFPSIQSVITGFLVFLIWVFLIPTNISVNFQFFRHLESAPLIITMPWLLFRIFGATLIVPISEEIVFRGYLLPKIISWLNKNYQSKYYFLKIININTIFSLLFTSLLFGILHSEILAGSIAGLFYGISYLSRKKIIDAIAAHAVTNALLSIYVIYSGNWSYW